MQKSWYMWWMSHVGCSQHVKEYTHLQRQFDEHLSTSKEF